MILQEGLYTTLGVVSLEVTCCSHSMDSQTQFMAQESALSSPRLERNELAGEKAALLDRCSVSESQLQNVKVCTYIAQHKRIVQHIYLEYIMCPTGSYLFKGLHPN